MDREISTIIVAGGMGKRLGADVPKAFVRLGGRYLFHYPLDTFLRHDAVAEIILVVPDAAVEKTEEIVNTFAPEKPVVIVNGGKERWQSVRNGVLTAEETSDWVLVHDAARPFMSAEIIDSLLEKRDRFKCVFTATPVEDTVRRYENDTCIETLDRRSLLRVGTPQLFHRESLIEAFSHAEPMSPPPTDEAVLMEKNGIPIGFVWGDPKNFKITTPHDLILAEALVSFQKA